VSVQCILQVVNVCTHQQRDCKDVCASNRDCIFLTDCDFVSVSYVEVCMYLPERL
jgi:hypothetical protein